MTRVSSDVVADAPDPADAARRLERIVDAAETAGVALDEATEDELTVLRLTCQKAPYLATLLARHPHMVGAVAGDAYLRREKPAEVLAAELGELLAGCPGDDPDELGARLRRFRGREMIRLGVRELELGSSTEVGRELAHLADVCFDAAIGFHDRALRARYGAPRCRDGRGAEADAELAVLAMGKHGGEELNFTSDVDVIYVYTSDDGAAGELSLHEYFAKLCTRVTASLGDVTEDGLVFRVDLRLRPEGSRGPIANSVESIERYYESWGRPWERQAWLKARAAAGSVAVGEETLRALRPFIYPRITSAKVTEEVASLNQRIKAELATGGIEGGFDLKNGVGGIREIEFFVQALQMIHAGHDERVRARTTLIALDQLLFAGIITDAEHETLAEAYRYLRHAEHVLQLDSGRQTQRLPVDREALAVYARRLGHADDDELVSALAEHTSEVGRLFQTLGADEEGPGADVVALLAGRLAAEREREVLDRLGFRDVAGAQRALDLARRKPLSPFGHLAGGAAARVAPELLAEIGMSPDPDQALFYVSELISRRGAWSSIWRLFDENRTLMRLVVSLFGTSHYLAKQFVAHPELIDALIQSGRAAPTRTTAELDEALDTLLASVDPDDDETRWNRLAEHKNVHTLRIGLADIAGDLGPDEVSWELSSLAEVCLDRAFDFVRGALRERHGVPWQDDGHEATLAILAMGKLGGRELGYASDLDVVFVYSGAGESDGPRPLDNATYMARLAQRLMGGLHAMHPGGRLYELDTRLRPSGSKGFLVSSLAGWRNYHRGEARLWERQALIKLRPVAGDRALGEAVARAARDHVWGAAPGTDGRETPDEIAGAIARMRDKIEDELAGARRHADFKAGRGGLVDIEFAAQYLQLVHGHAEPAMRTRSTVDALRAAGELGLADEDDCALLLDAWQFLRRLEHRTRIVHDRPVHRLPDELAELEKLARRTGYADADELMGAYRHYTSQTRAVFDRVLGLGRRD